MTDENKSGPVLNSDILKIKEYTDKVQEYVKAQGFEWGVDEETDKQAKLYEALSKAQGEMKPPKKNAKAHFGNYANLSSVLDSIRKPFADNDLSLSQVLGAKALITIIFHKDGGHIESHFSMPDSSQGDIQKFGARLTYARRYSVQAICGIEGDEGIDPDSECAAPGSERRAAGRKSEKGSQTKGSKKDPPQLNPTAKATKKRLKELWGLAKHKGVSEAQLKGLMKEKFSLESSEGIQNIQVDALMTIIGEMD